MYMYRKIVTTLVVIRQIFYW